MLKKRKRKKKKLDGMAPEMGRRKNKTKKNYKGPPPFAVVL